MKKIHLVVAGTLLLAAGVFANLSPRSKAPDRDQNWMAARLPQTFDGYNYPPSQADPQVSYRMSDITYTTLKAYGIVSRLYEKAGQRYDTVVIASANSDSFHDPAVCFQSQGSVLDEQRTGAVETKSHGTVPITLLSTTLSGQKRLAAFLYKGPDGFRAAPMSLLLDLFFGELRTSKVQEGVFYRFIALSSNATEDDLKKYVGEFLDASAKTSDGYF
ncbi:hypothetical protein BH11ARM2_BH11ARM2_01570 [soil metagenome]